MLKFQKQPMMRKVLIALAPVYIHTVWLYGPRALAAMILTFALGILTEWVFERKRSGKVSEAILVTCALYSLAFPPRTPLWILAVGIVFATAMAKGVYGGFGRNIFNPAIAGRLFVYIAFATVLNASYLAQGGFGIGAADIVASATPLGLMRAGTRLPLVDLLLGNRPGALGEGCILLILLAAVYLIATKTASWKIILSSVAGGGILASALYFGGVKGALPPESLLAGSFMFVTVFMATDPVSAPKKAIAQYVYGAMIGGLIVVIRTFSAFPEGTSFALLLGNTFASLIDELVGMASPPKTAAPGTAVPKPTSPGATSPNSAAQAGAAPGTGGAK